jgi:hypothetical protein
MLIANSEYLKASLNREAFFGCKISQNINSNHACVFSKIEIF